jgi:disulfide bond formation protein DsbB
MRQIISLPLFLLAAGSVPLFAALVSQYGFGYAPCHLCLLQRYPYLVVLLCGLWLWRFPKWRVQFLALAIAALLTTAGIGLYHALVEAGIVEYTGGCVVKAGAGESLDALRAAIANAPLVSCDQPMLSVLGLSMAAWNAVTGLVLAILAAYIGRQQRKKSS